MSGRYRVELTVGSYSWTVTETTKPASPGVLDGLRFGWRIPEGDAALGQPEPMTASFGLVADDVATYRNLAKGQNVGIKVWTHGRSGGTPEYSFYGRVTDLEAKPIRGGRIVYSLTAVDYLADLADATVGASTWSTPTRYGGDGEALRVRLDRIFADAGHACITGVTTDPGDPLDAYINGRTGSPVKALDLLRDNLRQTINSYGVFTSTSGDTTYQNTVRIVTPYANKDGLIVTASGADYAIDYLPLTTAWTDTLLPPFTVTRPGSTVTVTAGDPNPAGSVIDACRVELGAQWRLDKASGVNRAIAESEVDGVTLRSITSNRVPGDQIREATIQSDSTEAAYAAMAATLDADTTWYPPVLASQAGPYDVAFLFWNTRGDALPNGWTFDKLTWHLTADESAAGTAPRRLAPQHDSTAGPTNLLRWAWTSIPLIVLGIPTAQNLPGDTVTVDGAPTGYTVGVPVAVDVTVEEGNVTLDVVLARRLPRTPTAFRVPETNRLFQWDDFDPAPFTNATWSNVNDVDTWVNYRLARRP